MLETFCLRLAVGLVLALLILPGRVVNPRFYRIHLLIVLGLTVAAGAAAWDREAETLWLAVGLALAATLIGSWCWSLEGAPAGSICLIVTLAALLAALGSLSMASWDAAGGLPWAVVDDVTSAALLGIATTAMLMGHWYLIAPTMSLQPFMRLLAALFGSIGLRMLPAGVVLWQGVGLADVETWLWLPLRWGAGLLGPLVLGWMAWQAARIRSTQSATGILYVVVIFVFLGELSDQLLQGHLRTTGG